MKTDQTIQWAIHIQFIYIYRRKKHVGSTRGLLHMANIVLQKILSFGYHLHRDIRESCLNAVC